MNVFEINLEEGMPPCDEALARLKALIRLAKQNKYKCAVVVHGYGSSGKGGVIRVKARQWLNAQVRNGSIKTVISGEDFNILNSTARDLRAKFPELELYLRMVNHGVTIVAF